MAIYMWREPIVTIPNSNTRYYIIGNGNITDSAGHITFTGRNVSYGTEGNLTYIITQEDSNSQTNSTAIYNTSQVITVPFTFNIWMYVISGLTPSPTTNKRPKILSSSPETDNGLYINLAIETNTYSIYTNGGTYSGVANLSYGHWYNFCFTVDSSFNVKAYCDGEFVDQGTCGSGIGSTLWMLSRYTYRTDGYNGKASRILYQNEIWDADTIQTRYEQNKNLYPVSGAKAGKNQPKPYNHKPAQEKQEKQEK